VVLFIALIILVAMTLAGIGMMRSVDTGNVIAGNLAFSQSTLHASDRGTSQAFSALVAVANSANPADKNILNFNNTPAQACPAGATALMCSGGNINFPGYFSAPIYTCEVGHTCANPANYSWWTVDANWANAVTVPVNDPNGSSIATVRYLIHRMCINANLPPQKATCVTKKVSGCSSKPDAPPCPSSVLYRITTRSEGTRNTVSYTQTLVTDTEMLP
jgi:Tfp pilus assembly protein PilX